MYYVGHRGVYVETSHSSGTVFKIDREVAKEYADEIKNLAGISNDIDVRIGGFQTHKDVFKRTVNGQTEVCVTFPFDISGHQNTDFKFDIGIAFDNKTGKVTEIEFNINFCAEQIGSEKILEVIETINKIKNLNETEDFKRVLEKIDVEDRSDCFTI